jgi:hypothetical protein
VNTTSKSRSHTSDFFIIKTSFWSFKGLSRAALSELKSMVLLKQPSSPRCQPSFLATKKIYFSFQQCPCTYEHECLVSDKVMVLGGSIASRLAMLDGGA